MKIYDPRKGMTGVATAFWHATEDIASYNNTRRFQLILGAAMSGPILEGNKNEVRRLSAWTETALRLDVRDPDSDSISHSAVPTEGTKAMFAGLVDDDFDPAEHVDIGVPSSVLWFRGIDDHCREVAKNMSEAELWSAWNAFRLEIEANFRSAGYAFALMERLSSEEAPTNDADARLQRKAESVAALLLCASRLGLFDVPPPYPLRSVADHGFSLHTNMNRLGHLMNALIEIAHPSSDPPMWNVAEAKTAIGFAHPVHADAMAKDADIVRHAAQRALENTRDLVPLYERMMKDDERFSMRRRYML